MPYAGDATPRLGIRRPLGNELHNRANFRGVIDDVDVAAARKAGDTFTGPVLVQPGVIVADAPAHDTTITWNNAAVTFTAWKLNVTDTASASGSKLVDLQVAGAPKFTVTKAGAVTASGDILASSVGGAYLQFERTSATARKYGWIVGSDGAAYLQDVTGGNLNRLALTTGGNLGLGVTPSAWGASFTAFQMRDGAVNISTNGIGGQFNLSYNSYHDGTGYKAVAAGASQRITMGPSSIAFGIAPSVAAGAAQTWNNAITIGTTGNIQWLTGQVRYQQPVPGSLYTGNDQRYTFTGDVSTTPVAFVSVGAHPGGAVVQLVGYSNVGDRSFTDFVICQYGATPVRMGTAEVNAPSARTYSVLNGDMRVNVGSGTYDVKASIWRLGN